MYYNIESSVIWKTVTPVNKGWSVDKKYLVETKNGDKLLLRLSDIDQYILKKKEYEIIKKYAHTGVKMSLPVEFGICNDNKNVYMLLSWLDGRDLEEVLPTLSENEQYQLGREAGKILHKIHSISLSRNDIPTKTKKDKKLRQLLQYEMSLLRVPNDETAINFVKENIDKIWRKNPVYMHGDFHPGNLIYLNNGTIGVIDFNRWEVGDPYEEFYKLESFGIEISVPYCVGQIDAYFNNNVPDDFWLAQAVYVAHASLYSIKWSEKFGQKEIDGMVRRCMATFENYDYFRSYIPKWYLKYHNSSC